MLLLQRRLAGRSESAALKCKRVELCIDIIDAFDVLHICILHSGDVVPDNEILNYRPVNQQVL